jgi:hypothetical protein
MGIEEVAMLVDQDTPVDPVGDVNPERPPSPSDTERSEVRISIAEWLDQYVKHKLPGCCSYDLQLDDDDLVEGCLREDCFQYKMTRRFALEGQRQVESGTLKGDFCVEIVEKIHRLLKQVFPRKVPHEERPRWLRTVYGLSDGARGEPVSAWDYAEDIRTALNSRPYKMDLADIFEEAFDWCQRRLVLYPFTRNHALVDRDFRREFKGDSHRHLHNSIVGLNRLFSREPSSFDTRVLPIVQSSGTGKTRTTLELSTLELGFYTCIRDSPGYSTVSAPKQDTIAYDYLTGRLEDDFEILKAIASWLAGFFRAYGKLCQREKRKLGDRCTRKELAIHLASLLRKDIVRDFPAGEPGLSSGGSSKRIHKHSKRDRLIIEIKRAAEEFLASESEWCCELVLRHRDRSSDTRMPSQLGFFAGKLREEFEPLQNLFPNEQDNDEHYVHLVFDNALGIKRRLECLRSLLSHMRDTKFWVLLVDTDVKIAKLSDGTHSPPPFVLLPQDLFLRSPDRLPYYHSILWGARQVTHEKILELIPLMGRPLWNDDLWLRGDKESQLCGRDLRYVFEKLIFASSRDFAKIIEIVNQGQFFGVRELVAAASERFPLELAGIQSRSLYSSYRKLH